MIFPEERLNRVRPRLTNDTKLLSSRLQKPNIALSVKRVYLLILI